MNWAIHLFPLHQEVIFWSCGLSIIFCKPWKYRFSVRHIFRFCNRSSIGLPLRRLKSVFFCPVKSSKTDLIWGVFQGTWGNNLLQSKRRLPVSWIAVHCFLLSIAFSPLLCTLDNNSTLSIVTLDHWRI